MCAIDWFTASIDFIVLVNDLSIHLRFHLLPLKILITTLICFVFGIFRYYGLECDVTKRRNEKYECRLSSSVNWKLLKLLWHCDDALSTLKMFWCVWNVYGSVLCWVVLKLHPKKLILCPQMLSASESIAFSLAFFHSIVHTRSLFVSMFFFHPPAGTDFFIVFFAAFCQSDIIILNLHPFTSYSRSWAEICSWP